MGSERGLPSRLNPHRPPDQAPQLMKPDPGHRNDKFGCGEDEPKGRSRRAEYLQGKIVTIFTADNPRDDSEELEGGFP